MDKPFPDKSVRELEVIRSLMRRQLRRVKPEMIEGTLVENRVRCGNTNCRCARGDRHVQFSLTKKVNNRSYTTYVPKGMVDEIRQWNDEYKRAKQILKDLSEVNEAIIRAQGREKRFLKATAKKLRKVSNE